MYPISRQGSLLRGAADRRQSRHQGRPGHQSRRPGARPYRQADHRPLRRRQLRRLGLGPRLLGGRRDARPDPGLRLSRGQRRQCASRGAEPRPRKTTAIDGRNSRMALTTQTMTDEQRKSVAIEYLKAFDNGGVTSDGGSILDLFAEDAQVYFPKWGLANGKEQIGQMLRRRRRHAEVDRPPLFATSTGSSPAATWSSARAPAMASTRTARGGPACRNGAPAAGATCSRSATGRSSAASSISTPTTPGKDTARYPWIKK